MSAETVEDLWLRLAVLRREAEGDRRLARVLGEVAEQRRHEVEFLAGQLAGMGACPFERSPEECGQGVGACVSCWCSRAGGAGVRGAAEGFAAWDRGKAPRRAGRAAETAFTPDLSRCDAD